MAASPHEGVSMSGDATPGIESERWGRETKDRKGKTVTAVFGFELDDSDLKALAKQLKQHCGTGGSVKDGVIVVQGDHRQAVKGFLAAQGYTVKIAGG